jgi:hypothetical protein
VNPRTRRAALYAIAAIATLASVNALTHSYAGLYDWAAHHSLTGWQAESWPAEIDVFLAIGELALYVAYLDGWPSRQRIWPWATALIGLAVSVAGNVGHIEPRNGHPVILADRLTAATSPLAAFAGLAIGLLVLKMTRQQANATEQDLATSAHQVGDLGDLVANHPTALPIQPTEAPHEVGTQPPHGRVVGGPEHSYLPGRPGVAKAKLAPGDLASRARPTESHGLLRDANLICETATAQGERLSQRALARQLRDQGHRFSNEQLHSIAASIGLTMSKAA